MALEAKPAVNYQLLHFTNFTEVLVISSISMVACFTSSGNSKVLHRDFFSDKFLCFLHSSLALTNPLRASAESVPPCKYPSSLSPSDFVQHPCSIARFQIQLLQPILW